MWSILSQKLFIMIDHSNHRQSDESHTNNSANYSSHYGIFLCIGKHILTLSLCLSSLVFHFPPMISLSFSLFSIDLLLFLAQFGLLLFVLFRFLLLYMHSSQRAHKLSTELFQLLLNFQIHLLLSCTVIKADIHFFK